MAFYKLFQLNTGLFTGFIQPNTVQLYANASGVLLTSLSGQAPLAVGSNLTGALQASNTIYTGVNMAGISSNTGIFIPVTLSGVNYAIPAYRYS